MNRFLMAALAIVALSSGAQRTSAAFDLDSGNAAMDVVIPSVVPSLFTIVSPSGGDATLVFRVTTLMANAWFDAIAPYHPSAVGVYSRAERRPPAEGATNTNKNVALLYASYRVLSSLIPESAQRWRDMLIGVGLDPDDDNVDTTTAIGIGNVAGNGVVDARSHDGMNQLGDEGGGAYNRQPYADYTGYEPVNTPTDLRNPSRWQPSVDRVGMGLYKAQRFVTPQYALVEPYSYDNPRQFRVPLPFASNHRHRDAYRAQADVVLAESAALNDLRKMKSELFDNKFDSIARSALFAAQRRAMSLDDFVQFSFLTNVAAFDAGIAIWQQKRRYDAVRPFSAIRYLYRNRPVTAWGGPGKGTVADLPADEWMSYLPEADHPEYPSATTCFCGAHAQAARLFLDSDVLDWDVPVPAGSSRIEPGVTPATDLLLRWDTWSEFADDCGQSRLWAGVHFQAAIDESKKLCDVFGDMAFDFVNAHVAGVAPERR